MFFANPWGLLGLLALPVIVVIHLYHQRFRPLAVAGLHLWVAEARLEAPGRRRQRLPITASLILELVAAALLSLLLADPRIGQAGQRAHLVVILDNSASMSAVDSRRGRSLRELAVEELERRVQGLGRHPAVTILLTGRRPVSARWSGRLVVAGPRGARTMEPHIAASRL
ncbi:MAG: hypothetical protein GXP27_04075 [Planctomycetes bacterium]|nr:hypothetical protein [Planctomycetota bacterium]